MDISAILPVMGNDNSSSLNDDFSGQTPSGDNIFAKPLAARTFFRTNEGGLVMVSFLFDPKKPYGEDFQMASVTSDWMADLRDALTKVLVDEKDQVPKTKTLEETIWDQMTSLLPKETLAKNLFSDKSVFDSYTTLLKANVTKVYNEEKAFTEKLRTEKFSFSFEIAIDAYPQALGGKNEKRNEKTGVLTFNIVGIPDGVMPMPEPKEAKEGDDKKDDKKGKTDKTKSKKRKMADEGDEDLEAKKPKASEGEKLLEELSLTAFYQNAIKEQHKKFPVSATQFFDSINRWFSSVVSRKSAKLEKDRNRNPLYH